MATDEEMTMARPREFDEHAVLLKAMHAFWNKGYEATSLAELLKATGLSKSSLYDTFGNKRELFMAAFNAYRVERRNLLENHLMSRQSGYESIEGFMQMVLEHSRQPEQTFGCMSCNEAVELGPHDAEIQRLIELDFQGLEEAFEKAIERGKQDGSIATIMDSRQLAHLFTVTLQGIQVIARAQVNLERLENSVNGLLQLLKG